MCRCTRRPSNDNRYNRSQSVSWIAVLRVERSCLITCEVMGPIFDGNRRFGITSLIASVVVNFIGQVPSLPRQSDGQFRTASPTFGISDSLGPSVPLMELALHQTRGSRPRRRDPYQNISFGLARGLRSWRGDMHAFMGNAATLTVSSTSSVKVLIVPFASVI